MITSTLSRSISLSRLLHAGADVVGGVLDQELDRAAENAALLVDLGLGVFGALDLALRQRRQNAGQRIDHADLHRLSPRALMMNGAPIDLTGTKDKTGLDDRATT